MPLESSSFTTFAFACYASSCVGVRHSSCKKSSMKDGNFVKYGSSWILESRIGVA